MDVLVAGASRGIGAAIATGFARDGARRVVLVGRTRADLEGVAEDVRAAGATADVVVADLTDVGAARDAVAGAGGLDAVVVNAGTNQPEPFVDVAPETFDRLFGLNVRAAFFVAQAVARRLLDAKLPGSIINISSQMGHVGAARRTVYCASKHAMEGFTKAMAIELAPHAIRVNSLGPTFLETPMTKPFFENKAFRDEVLGKIKLGRLGQLEELTGAIVFLASDASSLMTGSALVLDGGWTAE